MVIDADDMILTFVVGEPSSCALLGYLQSVREFHCYDNIAWTWNINECLYLLYAWFHLLLLLVHLYWLQ